MDHREKSEELDLSLDRHPDTSAKITFINGKEETIGFRRLIVTDDDVFVCDEGKRWLKNKLNSMLSSGDVLIANYSQISAIRLSSPIRDRSERNDKWRGGKKSFERGPGIRNTTEPSCACNKPTYPDCSQKPKPGLPVVTQDEINKTAPGAIVQSANKAVMEALLSEETKKLGDSLAQATQGNTP